MSSENYQIRIKNSRDGLQGKITKAIRENNIDELHLIFKTGDLKTILSYDFVEQFRLTPDTEEHQHVLEVIDCVYQFIQPHLGGFIFTRPMAWYFAEFYEAKKFNLFACIFDRRSPDCIDSGSVNVFSSLKAKLPNSGFFPVCKVLHDQETREIVVELSKNISLAQSLADYLSMCDSAIQNSSSTAFHWLISGISNLNLDLNEKVIGNVSFIDFLFSRIEKTETFIRSRETQAELTALKIESQGLSHKARTIRVSL